MTKQEIKEEYKETEGNPEINKEYAANSVRFLAEECLVKFQRYAIITNPTHFAVAISYDS